jgi:hypothetical protein
MHTTEGSPGLELPSSWVEYLAEAVSCRIEDQRRWVTVEGLAAWLGCVPSHIYDLRQRGLPCHRLLADDGTKSKKLYFDLIEVSTWFEGESIAE